MTVRARRMLSGSISWSEKVNSLSDPAALLYTWNIPKLDDEGRGDASVFYLKTAIFPARDHSKKEVEQFRQEIIDHGLMSYYCQNGHEYWAMPQDDWDYHQRGSWQGKHQKPSKIPPPSTKNKQEQCPGTPKTEKNGVRLDKGREEKGIEVKRSKKLPPPDWLDKKLWKQFKDHRKAIKAKFTLHAEKLAITELKRLIDNGNNQKEVIEQSIMNGWKGLFMIKKEIKHGTKSTTKFPIDLE